MRFSLKAVDAGGRVLVLQLDANDDLAARRQARELGYGVLAISQRWTLVLQRARRFPTAVFSIELLSLLNAGLNVVEALQTLAEKETRDGTRATLQCVLEGLRRGESVSQAMEKLPESFSPLYVATVRSSERTGDLKDALARYIAYQERLESVRKKALAALLYPAILVVVGALVLAFLIFYVVPRFAHVYDDISVSLPFFSRALLTFGQFTERHAGLLLLACIGALASLGWLASNRKWRGALMSRLWRVPGLGERMKIYELARFYRTVGMLLRAGIPALKALDMVSGLLAPHLRSQLSRAIAEIRDGGAMSAALTGCALATPIATRMMAVGERSGQMGELMERIACFYDDETARFVDAFGRTLEPALMTALGLAVGLIVVLMYMPIFELAGAIQ